MTYKLTKNDAKIIIIYGENTISLHNRIDIGRTRIRSRQVGVYTLSLTSTLHIIRCMCINVFIIYVNSNSNYSYYIL